MNWLQFQLDLNELINTSEKRRQKFEQQEMARRAKEYGELLRKYVPDSTDAGSLPCQSGRSNP